MRICVYGAGAMGTSLGTALVRSKVDCDLVTRNLPHVNALREQGFRALAPAEMTGKYDVIFLATRQRDNAEIATFLKPFLKEDGAFVSVQNGLPEEGLAEILGEDRVYGCALGWGAELVAPGKVEISSEEEKLSLAIGSFGAGERLHEIAELLRRAFAVTEGDLAEIRFSKLVVNASFSTLSAISTLTFGQLAKRHSRLVLSLMRETIAVAKACGCSNLVQNGHDIGKLFSDPFARFLLPIAMKKHKNIRSGMLKDLERGRRCDVDFVAGAVVREGKKRGVPTPMLERAIFVLHQIEDGLAENSPESLSLI